MARDLDDISADYVYFCAYLAKDDPDELTRVNGIMLANFIKTLELTGAIKRLKRFILTCGFKHYGVHLGQPKQPMCEDDPLPVGNAGNVPWPSNFYYKQQQILAEAAAKSNWDWVCTLPEDVLGYAKGNFMNEATTLGLYCATSKALTGSELPFPGNRANYFAFNTWTSANMHAQFCLWAAKTPRAGNNIFNVTNGDAESFQNLWPRLAARFGCKLPDPMFANGGTPTTEGFKDYEASIIKMGTKHPIVAHAADIGLSADPSVYEEPSLYLQVDPEKWAQRPDVKQAWSKLRDRYKLDHDAWDYATWDFLTFSFGRTWNCIGNMTKARKLGWTGYADTWEELVAVFDILEKEKILPPADQLRRDF